jgi:putative DNA primase/helicase
MTGDIGRIQEALQFMPVGAHDERFRIGCMVKSELSEAGRDLWDEWREGRGDDEADSVWRSISENGSLKIGTLFHEAKLNGWHDDGTRQKPTPEQIADRKRLAAEQEAARLAQHAETARQATLIYGRGTRHEVESHPYAAKKRVNLFSLVRRGAWPQRGWGHALLIPLYDAGGKISTLQAINVDGEKDYLSGGRKRGCFHPLGKLRGAPVVLIAEGLATAAVGPATTDYPVAAAMDAGNLLSVAQAIRNEISPTALIVFLADNDVRDDGRNPGIEAAEAAASAVGGVVAIPELNGQACDWWDVWDKRGAEAVAATVRQVVASATTPADEHQTCEGIPPVGDSEGNVWPDPHPLAATIEPEPYPLDALPDTIRAAVEEVAGFVKAPAALVASSALAALSLACQAHIDAKRAEKLHGPVSLFLLTIADSGERKSTCDGFFVSSIRQYQEEQAEVMKPAIKEYQAAIAAWEAEREGIIAAIKQVGKVGK